jgi:hypothetical protein
MIGLDSAALPTSQKQTSGEFGLPTSTERAFFVNLTPNSPTYGWPVIHS